MSIQRVLIVIALGAVAWLLVLRQSEPIQVFASESEREDFVQSIGADTSVPIIALVTDWCPACRSFELSLEESSIPYTRVNIEQSDAGRALFEKGVQRGAPRSIPQVVQGLYLVDRRSVFENTKATAPKPQ